MESILGVLSETENIAEESPDLLEERVQKIYGQIMAHIRTPEKGPSIPLWRWVAVVASVLILAFGSYYLFEARQQAPLIELSQSFHFNMALTATNVAKTVHWISISKEKLLPST